MVALSPFELQCADHSRLFPAIVGSSQASKQQGFRICCITQACHLVMVHSPQARPGDNDGAKQLLPASPQLLCALREAEAVGQRLADMSPPGRVTHCLCYAGKARTSCMQNAARL